MKIENNWRSMHKKVFIFPAIEYEKDWDDKYLNIYFLIWKLIFRFRRKKLKIY